METSEVLNLAADLIEERGWSVGRGWEGDSPSLCLEGGIAAAMGVQGGAGYRCPAYHAVASYLGRKGGLFVWNDNQLYEHDADGNPLLRWRGGSRDAAHAAGRERVIAVLRATALIEAAKETAETREAVTS